MLLDIINPTQKNILIPNRDDQNDMDRLIQRLPVINFKI
jgi:hypothetical protein